MKWEMGGKCLTEAQWTTLFKGHRNSSQSSSNTGVMALRITHLDTVRIILNTLNKCSRQLVYI